MFSVMISPCLIMGMSQSAIYNGGVRRTEIVCPSRSTSSQYVVGAMMCRLGHRRKPVVSVASFYVTFCLTPPRSHCVLGQCSVVFWIAETTEAPCTSSRTSIVITYVHANFSG